LIAEDVAKVNPNLVVHQDGQIYTVRYEAVNAMLLKPKLLYKAATFHEVAAFLYPVYTARCSESAFIIFLHEEEP
jgi:hypothetical protein